MKLIDNINDLFGDELMQSINSGAKLKIAASCFSIYAYEALKKELNKIDSLQFIFTTPVFVPDEVVDKIKKEHREFHIPKREIEHDLHGSEFEIRLKNQLTQRAIARECANWIRQKASFQSNTTRSVMQQFACVEEQGNETQTSIFSHLTDLRQLIWDTKRETLFQISFKRPMTRFIQNHTSSFLIRYGPTRPKYGMLQIRFFNISRPCIARIHLSGFTF